MVHVCLPCASLRRCGKVVSYDSVSDWKYPLSCSMLLSGTFLPLSTPPLSLLLFFSPRSSLPDTFFALTLERYSFIPTIVCLLCFISLRNSWAGHVIEPSWGPTRTEEDALAHLQRLIASDPTATKWHVVLDNLNIHQSESLVRWVAQREGVAAETLGVKGKSGILQSMESRAAFLHDPSHQVVVYYTPKHASWMNQVEIWLSILVRKLLKRGNFRSLDDLRDHILAFIAYYNRTMAKPIKWTYTGLV